MKEKKITMTILSTVFCCLCLIQTACTGNPKRTITASEPLLSSSVEKHALYSTALEQDVPFLIYLPKGYGDGTEYPVWYGLHSFGANQTMWPDNGITELADVLAADNKIKPLIMVFPLVQDATAVEIREDLKDGKIDERKVDIFVSRELTDYIDQNYFTIRDSKARFIGGFSMGGMLALRIGLHHPDLFSKIGGYSPAVPSQDYSSTQLEKWLNPNEQTSDIKDIKQYAKKKGYTTLELYLDTGNKNDPFRTGVESLHEALLKRGVKSSFVLYEGGHSLQKNYFEDYLHFYTGK